MTTAWSREDAWRLERRQGVAIWRQLANRLAEEIGSGALDLDERLPTEAALAARFKVNRHTVRRAIAALVERGLVRVEQGRGMFVEDIIVTYPLKRRTSFSANLLDQGLEPEYRLVAVETIAGEPAVAQALGLRPGTAVIRTQALGMADGVSINLALSHFPSSLLGLEAALRTGMPISAALAASGVKDFRRRSTRIMARMPAAEEARILKQPTNRPVLITEAVDADPSGRPIRHGVTCFAAERIQITVDSKDFALPV